MPRVPYRDPPGGTASYQRHCASSYLIRRRAEIDQRSLDRGTHADQRGSPVDRSADQATRESVLWDQADVGAACRDNNGNAQPLTKPDGGDTVRIDVMRIDCVNTLDFDRQALNGP